MDNETNNKTTEPKSGSFAGRWIVIAVAVMAIVIVGLIIALVKANNKDKPEENKPVPTINAENTPTSAETPTPTGAAITDAVPTGEVTGRNSDADCGRNPFGHGDSDGEAGGDQGISCGVLCGQYLG